MSASPSSQTLGGPSRCGWVLGPSLDKIIKNATWRKHSQLVSSCRSALDKLNTLTDSSDPDPLTCKPLYGISSFNDAHFVLQPILVALDSGSPKVVEPALDCAFKLFSFGLIHCEVEIERTSNESSVIFHLIDSACKCTALAEEAIELAVLRLLLSAVRSPYVHMRGDCLVHIVKSCYNVYLGGSTGTNQICAKSVLAQMIIIVFSRVEGNSLQVPFKTVSVAELLEFTDRNLNEGNSIHFAQNFINEVVQIKEVISTGPLQNGEGNTESAEGESESCLNTYTKIVEDGFTLYKNLCKLSMKFSSQDRQDDQILLRGKILSLELLKVIMYNAGPIWGTNERQVSFLITLKCSYFFLFLPLPFLMGSIFKSFYAIKIVSLMNSDVSLRCLSNNFFLCHMHILYSSLFPT